MYKFAFLEYCFFQNILSTSIHIFSIQLINIIFSSWYSLFPTWSWSSINVNIILSCHIVHNCLSWYKFLNHIIIIFLFHSLAWILTSLRSTSKHILQFLQLFFTIVSNFIVILILFPKSTSFLLINLKTIDSWNVHSSRWRWI